MKRVYTYIKHILSTLVLLTTITSALFSQEKGSRDLLIKAMTDEMNRSYEQLSLPESPEPYFISCTVGDISYTSVEAVLGTVTYSETSPAERVHAINLLVGDPSFTSDYSYSGKGIHSSSLNTIENDYNQLRREFWQTYDIAYKFAAEAYNSKQNNIKNSNLSEEEKELPDMLPLEKVVKHTPPIVEFNLNPASYEKIAVSLSDIFNSYPEIFDSKVELDGIQSLYHYTSTEGSLSAESTEYVAVTITGKVRTPDHQIISDSKTFYAPSLELLPANLEQEIENFAKDLTLAAGSGEMHEYYLGPVLFINEASAEIFADNLVSLSGVIASRKPVQVLTSVRRPENISQSRDAKRLEERMGRKVVDNRITIKNRTDLTTFGNTPLLGSYSIDAQGVIPKKEVLLIENGILKNLISTRAPTTRIKESTGGLRYGARPRNIAIEAAPGILEISVSKGSSYSRLKENLIEAAIEEGLDYAYIVKEIAGSSTQILYKVDIKDGKETIVTGGEIADIPLIKLKRPLDVGKDLKAFNYLYKNTIPTSLIYPSGILIEDIEIQRKPISKEKESPLI
jgi:hypothetical protein